MPACYAAGPTLGPYPFDQSPCTFPLTARYVLDKPYRAPEEYLEAVARAP